jgi:hypothetical protein
MLPISGRTGLLLALAATTLTAGCATAERQQAQAVQMSGRQCFLPSTVSGFHSLDRNTVHVTVGASRVFELDVLGTCTEIDWSQRIGIRSTGAGDWVCSGMDAELIVPSPSGIDRCPVLGVRQLTQAEIDAARAARNR